MPAKRGIRVFRRGSLWWISYWLDGRRVRESLGTASKKVAIRLRDQKEEDLVLGRVSRRLKKVEVGQFLEEYIRHSKASGKRPKTIANDRGRLKAFFDVADRCHLDNIQTRHVQRFLDSGVSAHKWKPATILRYREVIHAAFEYARKMDYLKTNPASKTDRPMIPDREVRWLDHGQIREVLDLVRSDIMAPIVATYIYAGLRREEAVWLTRDDLELGDDRPILRIRAKQIGEESWLPKTRKNRIVPVHRPRLLPALERRQGSLNGHLWLFPSPKGCRWNPDNLTHRFRKIMKAANLQWTLLDLRHTYGSLLAQRGLSDFEIAILMGNSPEIVRKHYARLRPETMHERVEF